MEKPWLLLVLQVKPPHQVKTHSPLLICKAQDGFFFQKKKFFLFKITQTQSGNIFLSWVEKDFMCFIPLKNQLDLQKTYTFSFWWNARACIFCISSSYLFWNRYLLFASSYFWSESVESWVRSTSCCGFPPECSLLLHHPSI